MRAPMTPQLVVQKFGGSSVGDADRIRRVAQRIARARATGADLVVVVSAMGDTTDELLELAAAITGAGEPDARELDMLLATGEHQSATLVSMALHALGVKAISLTGAQAGITTDEAHGRARIANVEPRRVRRELDNGNVVIVAGFQGQRIGSDEDGSPGETTTLGRGGSDTTAVALAAALRAARCQIFTDVRGIFTADPRLVPDARQLNVIGYEEMLELAQQGAQVMQVRAVELGWINGVEIEVLSSFEDAPGTLIREDPLVEQRNKVRGLAHDRNVAKVTLLAVPDRPGIARAVFGPLADAGVIVDMIVQNVGHDGATDISFTVPRVELARAERVLEPVVQEMGARGLTTDPTVAKVSIVGAGLHNAPGYAARMFGTLADAGVNIEMISTSEVRKRLPWPRRSMPCTAPSSSNGPIRSTPRLHSRGPAERMTQDASAVAAGWLARYERFDVVTSTNDVVAGWLHDGTPEVCAAIADVQTAGRGRDGRSWSAPPGAALLVSVGFRPTWLDAGHLWRLGAIASLAMADACEVAGGLRHGAIHLKWPNDLVVIDGSTGEVRKLAGVLGETEGIGTPGAQAVIGIGANVEWARDKFPAELASTMTSLTDLSPGRLVDREVAIHVFLQRLEGLVRALRAGEFPADTWSRRQLTNGMIVMLDQPDGSAERVVAEDVDTETGALLVRGSEDEAPRPVVVGEIRHLRVGGVV
jgi:aspartate kinase